MAWRATKGDERYLWGGLFSPMPYTFPATEHLQELWGGPPGLRRASTPACSVARRAGPGGPRRPGGPPHNVPQHFPTLRKVSGRPTIFDPAVFGSEPLMSAGPPPRSAFYRRSSAANIVFLSQRKKCETQASKVYSAGPLPSRSYSALNSQPSNAIAATRYIHTSIAMLAPILPYITL